MSTRQSNRTRPATDRKKAAQSKTPPKSAGTKTAQPATEPAKADKQKPFCDTCGSRILPEDNDPFLGSVLAYEDAAYGNLVGALFLCGWQYQTLQKVIDGRPSVIVVGTPVDAAGQVLRNRRMVTATWAHRTDIGWVQMADKCGYSRPDGTGFQTRTAEQLVDYVGRNVAEWVLKPLDDEADPAQKRQKSPERSAKAKAKAKAKAQQPEPKPNPDSSTEPTIDPDAKGLPAGSSPAAPAEPEPQRADPPSKTENTEPGSDSEPDSNPGDDPAEGDPVAGVEEEVINENAA
ncbi:hypothetical protein [Nocardia transvalensis]|uniref:hypothetical protein n=1 Tax=Nocardia transvalensis TaxID=37333 RepID=UPI0018934881|nr:hypothetical protein [Nocardia transvalensis]MBF6333337.1 hypothetical protein [Nocardia transvalensis]